jgi:hypothetical protein
LLENEECPDDPFTLFNLGALYDEIDRAGRGAAPVAAEPATFPAARFHRAQSEIST